ncbi:alanine-zipper protein [Variovorax sp. J22P271]|uniref:alanine-zipper protein n=1 Tax=Variovorax davisae TaxID=3053515 RepID=UPI002576E29F|nr:alanine-zipper protein [Variovorax sp. J22P271]MDM0036757.1 alanine-zipper protein [Variovorax sp. J22P271]
MRTAIPRQALSALALFIISVCASAQSIPASSADSGRRAVVAVDQATINNNINNALNAGNNAWNYANSAYTVANTAVNIGNNAQYTANVANDTANYVNGKLAGGLPGSVVTGGSVRDGDTYYTLICVAGNTNSVPPVCPPGSGAIVFTKGQNPGESGGM